MESNDSKTKPEIILARARVVAECAEKLYDHANKLSEVVKKENPAPASQNYRRAESLDRLMLNLNAAISDMLDESPAHTVTPKKDHFGEGYKETHEAYGSIRAIRTSGFRKLFGSVLDRHSHYISVEITRASFDARDLDDSRHWSEHGYDNEIVRLAMSASQWADFISNMQDASDATIGGMVSRLGLGRLREIVAGDAPSENERKLIGAVVDAPTLGTGDDR